MHKIGKTKFQYINILVLVLVSVAAILVAIDLCCNFAYANVNTSKQELNNEDESNLFYKITDNNTLQLSSVAIDNTWEIANQALTANSDDDIPWFSNQDIKHVTIVENQVTKIIPKSMRAWFALPNCEDIYGINNDNIDSTQLTNLDYTFNCPLLESLDLSNFYTNNVTSMSSTFSNIGSRTNYGVSIRFGTDPQMTQNVTDMSNMFSFAKFYNGILDMSYFSDKSLYNIEKMFYHCYNLKKIYAKSEYWGGNRTKYHVGKSTFQGCSENLVGAGYGYTYRWNAAHVSSDYATCVDSLYKIGYFSEYSSSDEPELYYGLDGVTLFLSPVITTHAYTDAKSALNAVSADDIPWHSFGEKINFVEIEESPYCKIVPHSLAYWFDGLSNCNIINRFDNYSFDFSKVVSLDHTFCNCNKITNINFHFTNFVSLTNMKSMFENCTGLTSIYLFLDENFDVSKVDSFDFMFSGCSKLAYIYCKEGADWAKEAPVSATSENMFKGCTALTKTTGEQLDNINNAHVPSIESPYSAYFITIPIHENLFEYSSVELKAVSNYLVMNYDEGASYPEGDIRTVFRNFRDNGLTDEGTDNGEPIYSDFNTKTLNENAKNHWAIDKNGRIATDEGFENDEDTTIQVRIIGICEDYADEAHIQKIGLTFMTTHRLSTYVEYESSEKADYGWAGDTDGGQCTLQAFLNSDSVNVSPFPKELIDIVKIAAKDYQCTPYTPNRNRTALNKFWAPSMCELYGPCDPKDPGRWSNFDEGLQYKAFENHSITDDNYAPFANIAKLQNGNGSSNGEVWSRSLSRGANNHAYCICGYFGGMPNSNPVHWKFGVVSCFCI